MNSECHVSAVMVVGVDANVAEVLDLAHVLSRVRHLRVTDNGVDANVVEVPDFAHAVAGATPPRDG